MKLSSYKLLLPLLLALSSIPAFAQTKTVVENDFENGTQNWERRGERVSIKSAKDMSLTGAKSLKVTGRSAHWNGCQLTVTNTLVPGSTYQFTVSVKLDKGEKPDDVKMTLQRGDNQWDGVASTNATADEWTTFSGRVKIKGTDPYLLIYVEAARDRTSFYIDDFKIESVSNIPEQSGVLINNDFEDSTAQNWFAQGDNVQMFSTTAGGSRSLKVADRSQKWHGLALDISPKIFKGRTYSFSVSVKLVSGQTADMLKLTVKQTPPKGDPTYVPIGVPTKVSDGEWITLSGQYSATTFNNNILVYVEAEGESTSFYVDNFELKVP